MNPVKPSELVILDPKVETYCQLVANGMRLNDALAAAGFAVKESGSYQLAKKPEVSARIQELIADRLIAAGVSPERTKMELARIAFFDIRRLFDENGQLKPVHLLDDDTAGGIASVKIKVEKDKDGNYTNSQVVEIKAADKMGALNILSKHYKIIANENEGINAVAGVLADALNDVKRKRLARTSDESVIDAVEVHRRQVVDSSQAVNPENSSQAVDHEEDLT